MHRWIVCINECCSYLLVKWQPVEMFDLLKTLEPVRADWEDLAYNLIKKDQVTLKGHFTCSYSTMYGLAMCMYLQNLMRGYCDKLRSFKLWPIRLSLHNWRKG